MVLSSLFFQRNLRELARKAMEMCLRVLHESNKSRFDSLGGSVAEWSARRTRNPAIPGSSPALATCIAGFVLGRPEFKFSAMLVNSQLVAFCQLGFLILLCCI